MRESVHNEISRLLDKYVPDKRLNDLLNGFVDSKAAEGMVWSEITRCVHFMLGGGSPDIDRVCALTELVVLLSDMMDDLQDQDHQEKPWMQCDPAVTLNAVMAMFAALIGELGGPLAATDELGRLLATSVHGQQLDVADEVRTEEDYFAMVERKSGSLLQFACFMGYALAEGVADEVRAALSEVACCAGVIAQIGNDARDALTPGRKNDLLRKKRTLPVLFMLPDSPEEFPTLHRYYEGDLTPEEFVLRLPDVVDYVRSSGCLEYCQAVRWLYMDRMLELIRTIPMKAPWDERFKELLVPPELREEAERVHSADL